jgi:hypothetical protein
VKKDPSVIPVLPTASHRTHCFENPAKSVPHSAENTDQGHLQL